MVAYHRCTSPLHITIAYHRCSPLHVTVVLGQAVGPADAAADPAEAEGGEQRPWRLLLMRKPEQGAAQGCGHDSSVAGQRTGRRCRCHTCRCQRLCCRPAPGFRRSRLGCGRSGQPRGWSTWTGPSTASMWCILAAALLLFASVVSCCTDLTVVPFCASDPTAKCHGDTQGHVHFLERAKARGDYLLVGLHSDAVTTATHGPGHPIMGLHERALCLLACKVKYPPLLPPPTHVQLLERPLLERHPVAEPSLSLSCRLSGWTISCSGRRGPSHETCSPP